MQLLTLDFEDDYTLIGIHSSEDDYRLAYLLNKHLNTKLMRFRDVLDFEGSDGEFPLFEFKDETSFINYYLINNKHTSLVSRTENAGLFGGNYYATAYLIPERKRVDYFLKIEGNQTSESMLEIVHKLNTVEQIITSYEIDPDSLKSKDHLIF